ncbi:MAG: hypothetical protein J7604_23805 [Sporocytophaga sp.]|uniref:hypothetical protein n=1 Tax=Sporocytophaga sp. TaxID=2231183 RepID=UPI001B26F1A2|nr:hypothetical protein [Sporocytophaga sp.]MBO9703261.1 hypothetical protein [Sporocytophaga sp.]
MKVSEIARENGISDATEEENAKLKKMYAEKTITRSENNCQRMVEGLSYPKPHKSGYKSRLQIFFCKGNR